MNRIELRDLSKSFGRVQALSQINLTLERGKIYGLLGRNGAGKSTMLRLISGRLIPSSGEIFYDTQPILKEPLSGRIYHVEPENFFPEGSSLRDILKYTENLFPKFRMKETVKDMQDFDLNLKKKTKSLSTGQASIFRSVLALNTHEDFIFLDEPTLGFDVVSRDIFYEKILEKFNQDENTLVLSSHLIQEIGPLVERMIIIDQGQIKSQEYVEELLSHHYKIVGPKETLDTLLQGKKVLQTRNRGDFTTAIVEGDISQMKESLPLGFEIERVDLQDVFIALVNKERGEKNE